MTVLPRKTLNIPQKFRAPSARKGHYLCPIYFVGTSKYPTFGRAAGAKILGYCHDLVGKSLLNQPKESKIFWPPKAAPPKKVQNPQKSGISGKSEIS